MIEYALMGGGGLSSELFDYMSSEGKKVVGYYDLHEDKNFSRWLPYLGDEHHATLNKKVHYIIATGILSLRRKMIQFIEDNELIAGEFISKRAYVSRLATYGKGVVIAPFSIVSGTARLGDFVLMNINSIAAHDTNVGNNIVVGPGVIITGYCQIADDVTFGANAALIPDSKIGSNVEIGIGTFPRKVVGDNRLIATKPGKEFFNFKSVR